MSNNKRDQELRGCLLFIGSVLLLVALFVGICGGDPMDAWIAVAKNFKRLSL